MIVLIPYLDKTTDCSCYVIDLNDFMEGTSEVKLATKRGRYERTLPVEVEELILHEEAKLLKQL